MKIVLWGRKGKRQVGEKGGSKGSGEGGQVPTLSPNPCASAPAALSSGVVTGTRGTGWDAHSKTELK